MKSIRLKLIDPPSIMKFELQFRKIIVRTDMTDMGPRYLKIIAVICILTRFSGQHCHQLNFGLIKFNCYEGGLSWLTQGKRNQTLSRTSVFTGPNPAQKEISGQWHDHHWRVSQSFPSLAFCQLLFHQPLEKKIPIALFIYPTLLIHTCRAWAICRTTSATSVSLFPINLVEASNNVITFVIAEILTWHFLKHGSLNWLSIC